MKRTLLIEEIPLGRTPVKCQEPTCHLDAEVWIKEDNDPNKLKCWCVGHAHCEIAVWMVGM